MILTVQERAPGLLYHVSRGCIRVKVSHYILLIYNDTRLIPHERFF